MFKIPFEELIEKIKEKSGLGEQEISSRIDDKLKALSGLISKEGAAHIVANELGVKLLDETGGKLQIKNILTGMRSVETVGKVQQTNNVSVFQRKDGGTGKVGSLLIGDETGSIRVVLWGDQTNTLENIKIGDIVKVIGGYVRENNNSKEIHMNERGKIIINPEGETVGAVQEIKSTRKTIKELSDKDIDAEILATIVQIFDLRFFEVCPECGSRVRQRDNKFNCEKHNEVKPAYSYVLNLVLDDGTETVRCVFFRNSVEELLQIKQEEVVVFKDDIQKFDEMKNKLLGEQIKVIGRVNNNEMFNRLEFVVKNVNPKPDPEKEIDRLKDAV
ncbi:MAG: DUF2240 family protein [Nanoarchaeota archaeon]